MSLTHVTTPFGRRSVSLAHVAVQIESSNIEPGKSVDKWKVYRDTCEARGQLGLRDRALAVLNALLSFHPDTVLSEGTNLIVFPSNAQLTARANGIAGTTLRENLAHLVKSGLITRIDSPNGKRYAHRSRNGTIEAAYGFSLAPLLKRADDLHQLASQVAEERRHLKLTKDRMSIVRRDIRKLLIAAELEYPNVDWSVFETRYTEITSLLPVTKSLAGIETTLASLSDLHQEVVNLLRERIISQKNDANDVDSRWHIQNSESECYNDFEANDRSMTVKKNGDTTADTRTGNFRFPLSAVLRACPQIVDYGPKGQITDWKDLFVAANVVRSMLNISHSAYISACSVMGHQDTAVAICYILERGVQINSAGGYLRNLTQRAARNHLSIGPMLSSLTSRVGASLIALNTPCSNNPRDGVGSSQHDAQMSVNTLRINSLAGCKVPRFTHTMSNI